MSTQIMLDLETLGTTPGSVIIAIGAAKFEEGCITGCFYARVDAQSCVDIGLTIDASTVMFWLRQSDAARLEVVNAGKPIIDVLREFSIWVDDPDAEVWGNGASFDNALLDAAYVRAKLDRPWAWWGDRCYRTVKNLRPDIPIARQGVAHNALDDARSQAMHLMQILAEIKPKSPGAVVTSFVSSTGNI